MLFDKLLNCPFQFASLQQVLNMTRSAQLWPNTGDLSERKAQLTCELSSEQFFLANHKNHHLSQISVRQQGFTLIELMVVITLIAMISTSIVLTLPDKKTALAPANQAARVTATLRALSLKANLTQQWHGLFFSQSQFQPVVFIDKQWQLIESEQTEPLTLNNDFTLKVNNRAVDVFSINTQPSENSQKPQITPQILVAPSGLFNNFEMRFIVDQQEIIVDDPYASL